MLHQKFGHDSWNDFALHEPPSPEDLRQFEEDDEYGPDTDGLRLDMKAALSSGWNKWVREILYLALVKSSADPDWEEDWEDLPERSQEYFEEMIEEQLMHAKTAWSTNQPRYKSSGRQETAVETEKRVSSSKNLRDIINRRRERRRKASGERVVP